MKVAYVEVKNKTLPEDENIEGWGVLLNGHLMATDSYRDPLTCGEVAEGIAQALGAPLEERTIEVSNDRWNWICDVLPVLGIRPEQLVDREGNLALTSEDRSAIVIAHEFCMAAMKRGIAGTVLDDMDINDEAFYEALNQLNRLL